MHWSGCCWPQINLIRSHFCVNNVSNLKWPIVLILSDLSQSERFVRTFYSRLLRVMTRILMKLMFSDKMSFLGATLGNLHIPSIGGIKKQISKVMLTLDVRIHCTTKTARINLGVLRKGFRFDGLTMTICCMLVTWPSYHSRLPACEEGRWINVPENWVMLRGWLQSFPK